MQIHLVQHDIAWESPEQTCARVAKMLDAHSFAENDLLVLPEMFAVGFSMNADRVGEKQDGPTVAFLTNVAKMRGVHVIGGVPIVGSDGKVQNRAICVSPKGDVVAQYAKIQPFTPAGETANYQAGNEVVLFDWNGLKVAPLICYDLRFPELFRSATKRGAELFCIIANWPSPRANHRDILLPARALENQAYVAAVNRVGSDPTCHYIGGSRVIDPTGSTIVDAGDGEKIISCPIDPSTVRSFREKLPFLKDMRSDFVK